MPLLPAICVLASFGALFQQVVVDPSPPVDPWMKGVGDLNGDGRADLVVAGRDGPLVWYESPSWTRRPIASAIGPTGSSTALALGDVDRNGSLDVVLANGVWFANPAPAGDPESDTWTRDEIDAATAHDVALADLDGDGDLDVVKRHQGQAGDVVRVFRQDGGQTWTERTIPAVAGEGLAVGDLDADGDPDVAIAGQWFENDGNPIGGDWTPHVYTTSYTHPHVVVKIAQVGGASRPDIVLTPAEYAGGAYRISWFESPTDRHAIWPEHIVLDAVESVVHGLVVADFDRDGRSDLAYAEMHQGADPDQVRVLFQASVGSFSGTTLSSEGSHNLAAGDVDADGRIDLFGANHNTSQAPDGAAATLWLNRTPEANGALSSLASVGTLVALRRARRRAGHRTARDPAVRGGDRSRGRRLVPIALVALACGGRGGPGDAVREARDDGGALCNEAWYREVETAVGTGDGQGHGPDLGSDEWKSTVEFRLGVRGRPDVPPRDDDAWCAYVDRLLP